MKIALPIVAFWCHSFRSYNNLRPQLLRLLLLLRLKQVQATIVAAVIVSVLKTTYGIGSTPKYSCTLSGGPGQFSSRPFAWTVSETCLRTCR